MELTLRRNIFSDTTTIGDLDINGTYECHTLEDVVRSGPKVFAKTAINFGRYEVTITYSNRFKRLMPLLIGVPEFNGIRIHSGNSAADTEGCILVGRVKSNDRILESRDAFNALYPKIANALSMEKVFINIIDTRPGAVVPPPAIAFNTTTVIAESGLNLRKTPAKNGEWAITVPAGRRLQYVEIVEGQSVDGNSRWYKTPTGEYFWSGGVQS